MKINPINSGNIPFLKRKQITQDPIVVHGDIVKMVPDEEADKKSIIPKLRMIVIKEYGIIEGEKNIDGNKEK